MTAAKTILVTGGAGFLGSALCRFLLDQGHAVRCIDNFYTSTRKHTSQLLNHPNFSCIYHDLIHPIEVEADEIYHLASPASPRDYQQDPIYTLKTIIWGTMNMLELAKLRKIPLLLASTSEVYGNPSVHPQLESYLGNVNPIGPRACYDEGKRVAECLCFDYARMYGVQVHIVRIFNTYGPGMREHDGRVISNMIMQALQGIPVTVYGDGQQTRSLCYVDDLIRGIVQMMNHPHRLTGPINLGNPQEISILLLAHRIIELTHSRSPIAYVPLPQDDPIRRQPDITQARQLLGWQPIVTLDEGIQETMAYFRNLLKEGG